MPLDRTLLASCPPHPCARVPQTPQPGDLAQRDGLVDLGAQADPDQCRGPRLPSAREARGLSIDARARDGLLAVFNGRRRATHLPNRDQKSGICGHSRRSRYFSNCVCLQEVRGKFEGFVSPTENRGVAGSIPALAISECRMAAGIAFVPGLAVTFGTAPGMGDEKAMVSRTTPSALRLTTTFPLSSAVSARFEPRRSRNPLVYSKFETETRWRSRRDA
jgi:hypothetical protein